MGSEYRCLPADLREVRKIPAIRRYGRSIVIKLLLIVSTLATNGQQIVDSLAENLMEQLAERLTEREAGAYDLTEITEGLAWRLRHPLDLNKATAEDLEALYLLNDLQISALLNHIRTTGPLADVLELQSVRNFDLPLVRRLLPFVTVGGPAPARSFSPRDIFRQPEQELLVYYSRVLARQKGYSGESGSRLRGSPGRLRLRYRFRQGDHFRFHVLGEKDPGEAFTGRDSGRGFDFYSGNIFIRPSRGRLKKLVLGDYLLQFGQGLVLWNGFSLGKGPAALNIGRQAQGIKPHNSSGEGYFFRGGAASLQAGKMSFTPFVSLRKLDGTTAEYEGIPAISAIRRSGLHRNEGELAAEKTLGERLGGLHLRYRFSKQFSLGVTASHLSFDKPLLPGDDLYELHDFSGRSTTAFSLDYTFGRANYFLFGEIAGSRNAAWEGAAGSNGWAAVNGILVSPARGLVLAAAGRSYGRRYQVLYASPLSESSNIAGEKGIYLGLECRISSAWTFTAYADAFSWPWLRYRIDAPSNGYELLAQLTFRPAKKITVYGRYRKTRKPRNLETTGNKLREVSMNIQHAIRFHSEFHVNRQLRLRTRADFSVYRTGRPEKGRKSGYSVFQDVSWNPGKISFNARFTFFDTDDYDTRIYSYESSVQPGGGLTFYYDKGFKTYLGIRWQPSKTLDLRLRSALLRYIHRERIGSGPGTINGRQKPDIRLQARFRF